LPARFTFLALSASIHRLHASVPLFIFRVNVAKPQIALDAVHRRREIARQFVGSFSLALAV